MPKTGRELMTEWEASFQMGMKGVEFRRNEFNKDGVLLLKDGTKLQGTLDGILEMFGKRQLRIIGPRITLGYKFVPLEDVVYFFENPPHDV